MQNGSTIALALDSGGYKSVYCNSGGYLAVNGIILNSHYQDATKIAQLIKLGDISMLGELLSPSNSEEDARLSSTVFYGRDHQQDGSGAFDHEHEFALLGLFRDEISEYLYKFSAGEDKGTQWWFMAKSDTVALTGKPLKAHVWYALRDIV